MAPFTQKWPLVHLLHVLQGMQVHIGLKEAVTQALTCLEMSFCSCIPVQSTQQLPRKVSLAFGSLADSLLAGSLAGSPYLQAARDAWIHLLAADRGRSRPVTRIGQSPLRNFASYSHHPAITHRDWCDVPRTHLIPRSYISQ